MKFYKKLLCAVFCLVLLLLAGCAPKVDDTSTEPKPDDLLRVHYIDVGQGDSTFIELPYGETMLIDAGEKEYGEIVKEYVKNLGYNTINYVVGTHPHSDHIGGLEEIIKEFKVENIYMPKVTANTETFEDLLTAIKDKGLSVNSAKKDIYIVNNDDLKVKILSPVLDEYSDLNNYSVVLRIIYKNNSFLFTGDAEEAVESSLEGDLSCDVLKVGHHGSDTSSSLAFLKAADPEYAVISCGKDNKYGHPHKEVIDRLFEVGATIYRTDSSGNIVIESDGNNITVDSVFAYTSIKSETVVVQYVLNVSSKKIHMPDCSAVAKIKVENKQNTDKTVNELIAQGYTKCGICKPE